MPRRTSEFATALGLLVAATACGDGSTDDDAAAPVLATTSIWADITSGVGCGAEIPALIPAGADPHTFEPSLRDREAVERATTVITNGLDLEASVEPMLQSAADEGGVDVIEMSHDIDVLGNDPHVWQDPRRVAGTLDTIATALATGDIATCTDEYRADGGRARRRDRRVAGGRSPRCPGARHEPRQPRLLRRPVRLRGRRHGDPVDEHARARRTPPTSPSSRM